MAKKGFIEVLFELTTELPWYVAIMMGGAGFYFFKFYMPGRMSANLAPAWQPMLSVLGYGVLAICVLGAVVGLARNFSNRRLYKSQKSIAQVRDLSWHDFERLICEALRRERGFEARLTKGGADGGVDIVLESGGQSILVQCKHWRSAKIGVKPIRELAGVVAAENAMGGIFVCSGTYTKEARRFAEQSSIELIDGKGLVEMMDLETPPTSVTMDNVGDTCPRCGSTLVQRTAKRGKRAGEGFIGCSGFPKCRYTRAR